MKNYLGALGVLACALLGSARAQAAPGWLQLPGAATQIAVGASDYPIVLDTNGYIQYLGKPPLACGSGICVEQPRDWVFKQAQYADGFGITKQTPTPHMTRIAADLLGRAWSLDTAGGLWIGWANSVDGSVLTQMASNIGACATSLAPGLMQSTPSEWNHAFPVRIGYFNFNGGTTRNYSPTYITGCGSPSLSSTNITFVGSVVNEQAFFSYRSNGWQPVDTGEVQVAWFTLTGSNSRVPWIRAPLSSGIMTAWAAVNGTYVAAPPPRNASVTYITDHYVVAGNHVWQWNGDAYGNRGNPVWLEIANSYPPAGSTIKEIAYSYPVWWTREASAVGPSHLYMVDSANRIWQYGEVGEPPK